MPRTSLVAPKGAQRSLQNSKFRQKHENPYIRQFSLSIFTGNRANFLGSYLKKYSEIKKSESTFFYYFFYPLQLCHWTFSLKTNIDELFLFLFFFFFFFAFDGRSFKIAQHWFFWAQKHSKTLKNTHKHSQTLKNTPDMPGTALVTSRGHKVRQYWFWG